MSPGQEIAANSEGRAAAARVLAQAAGRLAQGRLEAARRDRKIAAALAAVIGLAGLAGWAMLLVVDFENTPTRVALGFVAALCQYAPLHLCVARCFGSDPEIAVANTVESTRLIEAQAERLGEVIRSASDEAGLSPTARHIVNTLLDDAEKAATAANDRERRLQGSTFERARRHVRIKPRHDRVVVTTHDKRKLFGTIIDVSLSGAAIEGNFPRIPIGAEVVIGSRKARAARALPRGMAFEFAQLIPAELLDVEIVL